MLERKEGAFVLVVRLRYTIMNLRRVRKELIYYFGSSEYWTAWCWIKSEWLLTRKDGRIGFLLECKRHKIVPLFIQHRIRTGLLLHPDDHRVATSERNFGLQVLSHVIRKEFQERVEVRRRTVEHRQNMFRYGRDDYLFTKYIKDCLVDCETRDTRRRLTKKLERLVANDLLCITKERNKKERVTCIGTTISECERSLLGKGPKFVPTQRKLTETDLRSVESAIESTVNSLRRQQMNIAGGDNAIPKGSEKKEEGVAPCLLQEPKIRRLDIPTQRATQPPKMNTESEHRSSDLKARIMKAYRQYRPNNSNITNAEKAALRTLKERDLIIKCSDKSKSMVVLDRVTYIAKAEAVLADAENYERTDMLPEALEKVVSDVLKRTKGLRSLPKGIYAGLFPKETKLPEFYGLPKIHKANAPLRPVVAAFDGPLTPISIFLKRIIHQLLRFVPSHIESTIAATRSLSKTFLELETGTKKDVIVVTMDVVALYPSIPIEDGITAVIEKLTTHEEEIDMAGLSSQEVRSLLHLVLHNNYFRFGDKTYRQKKGVAMGNHLAPPLAIVFMDQLEQRMLQTAELKPESYDRYVDDCLMVWTHGEANLLGFIDHCNKQHPSIRFTWESTAGGQPVSFMDLSISIKSNGLVYELYQKPSDSGVNLNFTSCVPEHVKTAVATQQFRRAEAISSNATARSRSTDKIKMLLWENGFREDVIEASLANSKKASRKEAQARNEVSTVTLRLPFCSDSLDRIVRRLVRKSGLPIRVAYKQGPSLKKRLVRSALLPTTCRTHDRYEEQQQREKKQRGKPCDDCVSCQAGIKPKDCDKKGAVYLLTCRLCSNEYVGETQRKVRTRLLEHQLDARKRSKETPWGVHMLDHPTEKVGKEPVFTARILAIESNVVTRKAREAIEIRDRRPTINRNSGWRLE